MTVPNNKGLQSAAMALGLQGAASQGTTLLQLGHWLTKTCSCCRVGVSVVSRASGEQGVDCMGLLKMMR